MKKINLCVLLILVFMSGVQQKDACAQSPGHVDVEYIKDIISDIASDEYQGRETGSQGCIKAEEYFANELRKLGLEPAGDSSTYFHHYKIPDQEFSVKATLGINDRIFYQGYNEDFSVVYKSALGNVSGDLVFAGYGIYDPVRNRNDFDTVSLKDKIVIIKRGAPRNDIAGWMPYSIDSVKADYCFKQGARGVLFFEPLVRTNQRILRQSSGNHLAMVSVLPDFPVFSVDERVVRYVFTQAGQSFYRIMNMIESQPAPFSTNSKCSMTATGKSTRSIDSRNILGQITGSDKKLRDEIIVIGAHIDHVGMDDAGKIWNGADDNASGTAVTLAVARAMIINGFKPRRTIVFAAWTGEELGLLGSKAWCERPTVDLKKTVVYFNLDMVATGNGKLNMPGTGFAPEVTDFLKKNLDSSMLKYIVWSEGGPGGSDHNNFLAQGIPAFAGMTAGTHPDYHQPGDDPHKINMDILELTGDIIYECATKISGSKEVLLTASRHEENRFKLFTFGFYHPVCLDDCRALLKDRNFKVGMINLSSLKPAKDPDENFINLLGALDKALSENGNGNKYVFTTSAYDAMMTRSGLIPAFNVDDIGMDELKFKVLARQGYRIAIIDSNSVLCRDTSKIGLLTRMSDGQGVGMILDNLPLPVLGKILTHSTDPCLILNSGQFIPPELAAKIKKNGHILVYLLNKRNGIAQDTENLVALIDNAGIDNVLVSPEELTEESVRYLQRFIKYSSDSLMDKDLLYKLSGDNFYKYAVKSLQAN